MRAVKLRRLTQPVDALFEPLLGPSEASLGLTSRGTCTSASAGAKERELRTRESPRSDIIRGTIGPGGCAPSSELRTSFACVLTWRSEREGRLPVDARRLPSSEAAVSSVLRRMMMLLMRRRYEPRPETETTEPLREGAATETTEPFREGAERLTLPLFFSASDGSPLSLVVLPKRRLRQYSCISCAHACTSTAERRCEIVSGCTSFLVMMPRSVWSAASTGMCRQPISLKSR